MSHYEKNIEDNAWLSKLPLTEHYVSPGQFVNMVNTLYDYTHGRHKEILLDRHVRLAISNLGWATFDDSGVYITPLGKAFLCETNDWCCLRKEGQIKLKIYFIEHLSNDAIIVEDEKGIEIKPFAITEDQANRFEFSETPLSLLQILGKINRLVDTKTYKKLRSDSIADFLVSSGLLEIVQLGGGRFLRRATKKGNREGIKYVERKANDGNMYWGNVYDKHGQFYIIDNIQTIVEFNNGTRKLSAPEQVTEEQTTEQPKYTCKDCMDFRNGNCFGGGNVCEDFRFAYTFSQRETENWPTVGDATYLRFKGKI